MFKTPELPTPQIVNIEGTKKIGIITEPIAGGKKETYLFRYNISLDNSYLEEMNYLGRLAARLDASGINVRFAKPVNLRKSIPEDYKIEIKPSAELIGLYIKAGQEEQLNIGLASMDAPKEREIRLKNPKQYDKTRNLTIYSLSGR